MKTRDEDKGLVFSLTLDCLAVDGTTGRHFSWVFAHGCSSLSECHRT